MKDLDSKAIAELIRKAKAYDEISDKIDEFYQDEDEETGLDDIGEYIASYFGWL